MADVVTLELVVSVDAENPVEGDLRLEGGDLVWLTDPMEIIAQKLRVRFRFFKGEWFLDLTQGVPYYQSILVKAPSRTVLEAIFRQVILSTPGVVSMDLLTVALDNVTRELSVEFRARVDGGRIFDSRDYGPFLVRF